MVGDPDVDIVLTAVVGARRSGRDLGSGSEERARPSRSPTRKRSSWPGRSSPTWPGGAAPRFYRSIASTSGRIFQALQGSPPDSVERIVLTASSGPFRGRTRAQLARVTVEEALRHPTWRMGKKISVDSATLMNKALEVIEARWLFGLAPEQIEVIVHPESIIHSFVEFKDGSVLAQLSPPDMRLPIQYALTYPGRRVRGLAAERPQLALED